MIQKSKKILTKKSGYKKKKDNSKANVLECTKTITTSIKESEQYIAR